MQNSLPGVHIEEEGQEEEVDNSLRGRLVRLLAKVKRLREKKVLVEPEPQEDKKPSEPSRLFHENSHFYLSNEFPNDYILYSRH